MTRQAARLIWGALVVTPFLFAAVTFALQRAPRAPQLATPAFWLAALASAVNVTLSRVLPPRLGPRAANHRDAVAFTRHLVGFALCDAAALAPLVAFIVTRDARLLGLVAVDVLALILLYPSESRWQRLLPEAAPAGGPGPRGVR
jgi:hypothetical protein